MKIKVLTAIAAVALALTGFASPAKGSSISKAKSLGKNQSVTLVNEYDTDEKEYLDEGVAYYKIELKRGQAYTIWIEGGNASEMMLDVDTNWEYYDKDSKEDKEPGAGFDIEEINNGNLQYAYLYADDWDLGEDGDPKKGKYIVMITGNIGARTTLHYVQGIKSFTIVGTEESPKALSFASKWKGLSTKCIDGEYNMRATLKGGRKYRVYTTGGTKDNPLSLDIDDGNPDDDTNENAGEAQNEEIWEDPAYTNRVYDEAYIIVPDATGKYMFTVAGDVSQKFKFYYMEVPARAITAHPAIPLLKENDYSAKFVPGRMSSSNSYYDQIVDEHLCKIYLAKGERWVFDATGSNVPVAMYAYDSKGKIITSNEGVGNGSFDARVSVTATAAGIYYVGVCDPLLDIGDTPDPGTSMVTITARNATEFPAADDFDPTDDTIAGANMLTPYPATTNDFVLAATAAGDAVALGAVNGGHALGQNDIYDVFAIPCRKGFTYKLKASWENDEETTDLDLGCKVFFQNGKAEKAIATTGSISPRDGEDLEFKAIANGMHYVRVFVANGLGLEYPPYKVHAIAANGMSPLGLVGASVEGGVGSWSLNKEDTKYPSGAVVAIVPPAAKTVTVKFNAATGFTATPASAVVEVPAWSEGAEVPMASAVYADAYDKKYQVGTKKVYDKKKKKNVSTPVYSPEDGDATPAGAFAIAPAASAVTLSRTLWKDDAADVFKFTAVADNYYNFKLIGTTNVHLVVSNAVTGVVVAEGTATVDGSGVEIAKATLPAGLSYLIVTHGDVEDDGSPYKLVYSKATTGTVKFVMPTLTKTVNKKKVKYAADCYTVKEGVEYATLTVARTAKEGKVRVRYSTQAMSDEDAAAVGCLAAQPGVDYYPVIDGVVTWAAGDMKNKTIKVRTIPSHAGEWASSNRVFSVKLYPVDEEDDEFRDNGAEYLARVGAALASANVKIAEADKVAPGMISLAMLDDFPVANAKKPAVTGKAGTEGAQFVFTRTGGTDGEIAINVTTPVVKGDTAKAGVDFAVKSATRLVWADGDDEPKTLEVDFLPSGNLAVTKKFTLTMAAVKGAFTPTLAAKTAAVTITSDKVQNTSAAYAKQLVAANGGKIATSGAWYQDMGGELRSADGATASITYTVAGPGLFRCRPQLIQPNEGDDGTILCKIGKGAAFECGGEVDRVLPAGSSTVTFSLTGVTGGAYMSFDPIDGDPYEWTPFSKTVPYNPMNGAVVMPDTTDLSLTLPDALKDMLGSGLHFRVRFGTAAKPADVIAFDEANIAVPITLEAGKTYYWTVDYAWDPETPPEGITAWTAGPTVWKFSVVKAGQPIIAADYESVDAAGVSVADRIGADECLELIQGVKCDIRFTDDDTYEGGGEVVYRFAGGTLPKGMSVNATSGALAGAPSVVGETRALLQSGVKVTTKVKKNGKTTTKTTTTWLGSTVPVKIKVIPAGTSLGSFRGVLEEDGEIFKTDPRRLGVVSFTAATGNKLSASVTIGGVAYKFTGTTGYDEIVDRDDEQPGAQRHFRVKLTNTTKIAKKNYVNYLTLLVADGISTNLDALAACAGEVEELAINVANPKKTAVTAGVVYRGALYRNSGTVAVGADVLKNFAGYYTMGLVPEGVTPDSGLPTGNGYLTMTVAATGAASFSGALADGTAISGSSCVQFIGEPELDDARKYVLSIPVYAGKSTTYTMNGVVQIAYELTEEGEFAATPVVLPQSKLFWAKPASAANSRDGSGFIVSLAPTGGWYDKTKNLQAYYLNRDFAVNTVETGDDLPIEALAKGYSFSADSTPRDLGVKFTGNTLTAGARSLVKTATTGLYDTWQHDPLTGESVAASVNPWAVAFKFNRANGIISGTLSAWEWTFKEDADGFRYATAQKEIKKLAHKGVWLWSRDSSSESPLDERAASAGFFLMPATKKWKASMPFNVITVSDDEKNWEEKELPSEE